MYELTKDRYLVDTGATLSIAPSTSNTSPSDPSLRELLATIPSWGFVSKTVQFQGKLFTAKFLQAGVAGPILGMDFLRKFRITVAPETSQVLFTCTATAPAAVKSFCSTFRRLLSLLFLLHRQINQSLILCLKMWSFCFKNSPPFCTRVMRCPSQPMGWNITFTRVVTPIFAKYRRLDLEKHEIAKVEFKRLESASTVHLQNPHGPLICTWSQKNGSWWPCGD